MKYITIIFLFLFVAVSATALPGIYVPPSAEQGQPLRILVENNESIHTVTATLSTSVGRVICYNNGFLLPIEEGKAVWVVLLGVPSTLSQGDYIISVKTAIKGERYVREKTITVTGKNFLREDIALDKSMTELRDSYDPRKVKEARIMLALLRTSMPRAIYDTEFPYQQPLTEAVVSSHFGDRRTFLYSDGGSARAIHFGVDLVKPKGWPVKASGTGKVAFADQRILTGKSVVLEHLPGVYSLYYHLDSVTVDEGALVDRGAVVGTVGSTGLVTGAHLHWEIRVAAVPVNPYSFVQGNLLDKNEILSIISSKHFTKGR